MKFLLLLLFTSCAIPQPKPNHKSSMSYKERVARRIESCMLRLVDRGVEEKFLYQLCGKTHRPVKHRARKK